MAFKLPDLNLPFYQSAYISILLIASTTQKMEIVNL